MPKKKVVRKTSRKAARRRPKRIAYQPPTNDHLTPGFESAGLVPDRFRGSDEFLDVLTWNIKFFHDRDKARVDRVTEVLAALNADIMVFEEILDGSLDVVAEGLGQRGAGNYVTAYGTTGGQQRVAMMWDIDWIRAKDDVQELFSKGEYETAGGKDAFPRLPLWSAFTALPTPGLKSDPFDLQLVGLHLKSQRGGGADQRKLAADVLALWLQKDAVHVDADVVMIGDWNESPKAAAWQALRELEKSDLALFESINNSEDISHFYYKNKTDLGSRLDLAAVSIAAAKQMASPPTVVRWTSLDTLLKTQPKAQQIKDYIKEISDNVSDHMPVVMRFFFEKP
jgi:endonuclease/exonuclease/phosphatase family metal-dependent hydrolase